MKVFRLYNRINCSIQPMHCFYNKTCRIRSYQEGLEEEQGVIHGKGGAIIMMTRQSEFATFTAEGIGRISSSGDTKWCGSLFYSTPSKGKLSFLNNMIGVFEGEFGAQGNFTHKTWEWK